MIFFRKRRMKNSTSATKCRDLAPPERGNVKSLHLVKGKNVVTNGPFV
jgi:hypothetical protein